MQGDRTKYEDMMKRVRLNEAWDAALKFKRSDDIDEFKKMLDENDEFIIQMSRVQSWV